MESNNQETEKPSGLLLFPSEIRNQIYGHLFASTRLAFGRKYIANFSLKCMKPSPNALSILGTCRQIYAEAGELWLSQVLFVFDDPGYMLDKLSLLPPKSMSQIRHVHICGCGLMLAPVKSSTFEHYTLASIIKLLPHLRLDTLTVLSRSGAEIAYETLEHLIQYSNGWKELHFITHDSKMLALEKARTFYFGRIPRKLQPSTWNEIMTKRDGVDSGASVTIYRLTHADAPSTILQPGIRQLLEQKPPSCLNLFGRIDDKPLANCDEIEKAMLVIVKRGRHTDILNRDEPSLLYPLDIRSWAKDTSWPAFRQRRFTYNDGPVEETPVMKTYICVTESEYNRRFDRFMD